MSHAILPLRAPAEPVNTPVPMIDLVEQYEAIRDDIQAAVQPVFDTQRFILGEEVAEFEREMEQYCDAHHAIGCASGTDALILALRALDIGPGDEVITTPFSFFATASCISRVGATPVFADIDPVTFNIAPQAIEAAITPRTRAIIPVHLFGQCAEMEPIWRLAVQHELAVIEDAAQAIGAGYRGRRAGVLGNISCFSFFPTKNLGGAGDGGLMTTDDPDLAARLRRLRVHGDAGRYEHLDLGMNSRLDAIQAAVLRVKLRHLDSWTSLRQQNASRYQRWLSEAGLTDLLRMPQALPDRDHVWNQFCVRVADGQRDAVLTGLQERQVGCAVYYPKPLHLQPCFAHLGYQAGQFPESERLAGDILALPIYPELGEARQHRVVEALCDVASELRKSRTLPFSTEERRAA
ncbi:MAG: DegT/DnrJ/EryC1/StrS family aminotransferase [Planctomycetaceae bacterium]